MTIINNEIHLLQVINIHRTTDRFLSLIRSLQLKICTQLDNLDWANDILEHWKTISVDDPEIPETSKIRVLTGTHSSIASLWYCIVANLIDMVAYDFR